MEQTNPKTHRDLISKEAVKGVIEGDSIHKVSKNLGISRGKCYRLLFGATGQDILTTAFYESLDVITYHLPELVSQSIDVLQMAVTGKNVSASRILAARTILERVDRIENLLNKSESPQT
jgi:hypothetical protein